MHTLKALFLEELSEQYESEKLLIAAMPEIIHAAVSRHLRNLLNSQLSETEYQLLQLQNLFSDVEESIVGKKCLVMEVQVQEVKDIISNYQNTPAIDAAIIFEIRKIKSHEIAAYESLTGWANLLGKGHASDLLQEILSEELLARRELSDLALACCDREAFGESSIGDFRYDEMAELS
jgi:ferritin-like metal-binding protein YciE